MSDEKKTMTPCDALRQIIAVDEADRQTARETISLAVEQLQGRWIPAPLIGQAMALELIALGQGMQDAEIAQELRRLAAAMETPTPRQ